jgi:hypothetical protein
VVVAQPRIGLAPRQALGQFVSRQPAPPTVLEGGELGHRLTVHRDGDDLTGLDPAHQPSSVIAEFARSDV